MQVQEHPAPTLAPPIVAPPPVPAVRLAGGPPREPKPRSGLGLLVLSVAALALGILGMVDLAGAAIDGSAYLAVPLTIVGLGLVLGGWYGRARWLIAIGVLLAIVLGITSIAERVSATSQSVTWRPTSIEQLDSVYRIELGTAVLDLSAVDFTGRSESVRVQVGVGDLTVILPPAVDVRAEVGVDVGNAAVFGTNWGGIGVADRTVTDTGADGVGGGDLLLSVTVDVGDVEVRR